MSVSLTLRSVKGSRLTNNEVDTNFTNISDELDLKAPLASPSFTGVVDIDGDLTVSGTTTFVNTQNLSVAESMIYLNRRVDSTITNAVGDGVNVVYTADNNYTTGDFVTVTGVTPTSFNVTDAVITSANATSFTIASTNVDTYTSGGTAYAKTYAEPDLGIAGGYNETGLASGYAHAGLFRDATDDTWKFYDGYTLEPDSPSGIDTGDASFNLANLAAGDISATNFNSTSDISLKTNINRIPNALDIAKQLEGVYFDWKDSGKPSIGVVAQQVEEILPIVVNTGSDGIKRVSYDALIPVLIEAIKELSAKIENQ